nr:sugar ABC transporter ATP-binding protein [Salirhabdus salicampi]
MLKIHNVSKQFGGNKAIDSIELEFEQGQVHSLVGENGAGKSTLIKIITGVYQPNEGVLFWEGDKIDDHSPKRAQQLGIHAIHQERQLVSDFNGLENLFLHSRYPVKRKWFGIDWKRMEQEGEALKQKWGIDIPLNIPVSQMTPSEQTLLEVLRAMSTSSKLLILDEPTASLTDKESTLLFSFIERLKERGVAIIYISHRLEEVMSISDRVTVLTGGKVMTTLAKEELSRDTIIHHMTDGGSIQKFKSRERPFENQSTLLQVENLSTKDDRVKKVDFSLHAGEVLGVYGLAGSGRTETLEAIYGIRAMRTGYVRVREEYMTRSTPEELINRGVVMIPEDRHKDGLIMTSTLKDNITLPVLKELVTKGKISKKAEARVVKGEMERFQVKATSPSQYVSELSGGNQQKVVFAKSLLTKPSVFLCDEPTQAVDVMTRSQIHSFLKEQADLGHGIVFVSSDVHEIVEVSDRILIFNEGETVAELQNEHVTTSDILEVCYNFKREGVTP